MNIKALDQAWAKSLYHRDFKDTIGPCTVDYILNKKIHKFNLGKRTCKCGEITIKKEVTHGGWKRISPN